MLQNPFEKIIELLDRSGAEYRVMEHEDVFTSEEAARVRGLEGKTGAKALLLKSGSDVFLLVLPGNRKLDNKKARNLLGVRDIRFATPEEVEEISGAKIGAVYPLGPVMGIRMFVDITLAQNEYIAFNPGVHHKSVIISFSEYQKAVNPVLADLVKD